MISYNPLWKTLIDNNKKKLDLFAIAYIAKLWSDRKEK